MADPHLWPPNHECHTNLVTSHLPHRLGTTAAKAVASSVFRPTSQNVDIWLIHISLGLFSFIFEAVQAAVPRVTSETEGGELLQVCIAVASEHLSELADQVLTDCVDSEINGRVGHDFTGKFVYEVTEIFAVAMDAMDARGYGFSEARTHALFIFIDQALKTLVSAGAINLKEENRDSHLNVMKQAFEFGEAMARRGQMFRLQTRQVLTFSSDIIVHTCPVVG